LPYIPARFLQGDRDYNPSEDISIPLASRLDQGRKTLPRAPASGCMHGQSLAGARGNVLQFP